MPRLISSKQQLDIDFALGGICRLASMLAWRKRDTEYGGGLACLESRICVGRAPECEPAVRSGYGQDAMTTLDRRKRKRRNVTAEWLRQALRRVDASGLGPEIDVRPEANGKALFRVRVCQQATVEVVTQAGGVKDCTTCQRASTPGGGTYLKGTVVVDLCLAGFLAAAG